MKRPLTTLRIGDVARLLDVPTHVIRHWEDEFAVWLRTARSKSAQRYYRPDQVVLLQEIQRLLRVELYTTAGAKRQLRLAAEREREAG